MFEKSNFIWTNDCDSINTYAELYTDFQIAGKTAICNISCDGDYTLFINGQYVSSNQYGDFEHYKVYDEIDISPFIKKGKNHLAVVVWHFGEDCSRYKLYPAGVIFDVREGDELVLASDEHVLARRSRTYTCGFSRHISSQLGFSFEYDSTKEDNWLFGEGEGFENAIPVAKKCNFYPRPTKKLSLGERVLGKVIFKDDNSTVYDLGREYVGLLSLECEGEGRVSVAYGECLKNGHVKRKIGDREFCVEYISQKEANKYTNYMLRLACRYVEISTQGEANVKVVGIIPQFYDVKARSCEFLSGKDKEIYDICIRTLQLCMMEHYVDCPWREQCLYAFDSRNQMLCGYYVFENGNFEYARENLMLLAQGQRPDGLLSICSPCGVNLAIPSFSLHFINAVKEHCEYSGDTSLFVSINDKIKAIINAFLSQEEDGAIQRFDKDGYWNFYDWSPHLSGDFGRAQMRGTDVVLSSLVILALNSYKALCEMAGLPFEYEGASDRIKAYARAHFFDTESGFFAFTGEIREPLELANSLAILAGLCKDDEASHICEALKDNRLVPCSLSMKCFKYDALLICDKQRYKDTVLNEIRATYEKMIPVGTVWETDVGESDFGNAGSLCHGWSAIPIYYYNLLIK